jgi:alpha,alpha-trehalase
LYSNLTAAAESGWDFSSRWFRDAKTLGSVETARVLPVDLNVFLCENELKLSTLFAALNNSQAEQRWKVRHIVRKIAVHHVLWSSGEAQWRDYDLDARTFTASSFSVVSNFLPLFSSCYNPCEVNETSVADALVKSGLIMPGGVVTSLDNDGQQWDYPNAWAPLQMMLIEGLQKARVPTADVAPSAAAGRHCELRPSPSAQALAFRLARRWLFANSLTYNLTGYMMEKYYAPEPGWSGGGGEYVPQTGFGWTNGVALTLIDLFADEITLDDGAAPAPKSTTKK